MRLAPAAADHGVGLVVVQLLLLLLGLLRTPVRGWSLTIAGLLGMVGQL